MTRPTDPKVGQVHVDDDLTLWRHVGGGWWDQVERLGRRASDLGALNREFGGRFVTVSTPGRGAVSTFAKGFHHVPSVGTFLSGDDVEWPLAPDSAIVHDPVGRDAWVEELKTRSEFRGRGEIARQLDDRAATLMGRFDVAVAAGADEAELNRLDAAQWAVQAEADLANGRVPPVTPTSLDERR